MEKLRVIIIDDEQGGRNNLSLLIKDYCPEVEVVGFGHDVISGLQKINELKPDLIFLDIEMPQYDGFKLVELLDKKLDIHIIFTTAYSKYAIQAVRASAIDYLLKPISISELEDAIKRVQELKETPLTSAPSRENKIAISHQDGYSFIKPEKIIYIEADRSYATIYLLNGNSLIVTKPLAEFEELLGSRFFRSHRSYLINIDQVKEYVKKDGGYILLTNDIQVGLAKRKKEDFFKLYQSV